MTCSHTHDVNGGGVRWTLNAHCLQAFSAAFIIIIIIIIVIIIIIIIIIFINIIVVVVVVVLQQAQSIWQHDYVHVESDEEDT